MTTMFLTNAEFLEKFFKICIEKNLNTEEERMSLLIDMAKETGECAVSTTERTKKEIVQDISKHYKKVLWVKGDENGEA